MANPDFRITLLPDGSVRLVDWGLWLTSGGPLYTLLHARGRAGMGVADLTVLRDDDGAAVELIAEFRTGGGRGRHRAALLAWAATVGYRRVWLTGEVVELEPCPGGPAQTRCTGCQVRLVDDGACFWEFVRNQGAFPATCVLCGSDLPQWTSLAGRDPRAGRAREGHPERAGPDRRAGRRV